MSRCTTTCIPCAWAGCDDDCAGRHTPEATHRRRRLCAHTPGAARQSALPLPPLGGWGHPLAPEHRRTRKEALVPGPLPAIVIDEFERPLPELEHRDVGWGPHVERAAVGEGLEDARCPDGRARDHPL